VLACTGLVNIQSGSSEADGWVRSATHHSPGSDEPLASECSVTWWWMHQWSCSTFKDSLLRQHCRSALGFCQQKPVSATQEI